MKTEITTYELIHNSDCSMSVCQECIPIIEKYLGHIVKSLHQGKCDNCQDIENNEVSIVNNNKNYDNINDFVIYKMAAKWFSTEGIQQTDSSQRYLGEEDISSAEELSIIMPQEQINRLQLEFQKKIFDNQNNMSENDFQDLCKSYAKLPDNIFIRIYYLAYSERYKNGLYQISLLFSDLVDLTYHIMRNCIKK